MDIDSAISALENAMQNISDIFKTPQSDIDIQENNSDLQNQTHRSLFQELQFPHSIEKQSSPAPSTPIPSTHDDISREIHIDHLKRKVDQPCGSVEKLGKYVKSDNAEIESSSNQNIVANTVDRSDAVTPANLTPRKLGQTKRHRFRSKTWKFFRKTEDNQAECLICGDIVTRPKGTTWSMMSHLKKAKHLEQFLNTGGDGDMYIDYDAALQTAGLTSAYKVLDVVCLDSPPVSENMVEIDRDESIVEDHQTVNERVGFNFHILGDDKNNVSQNANGTSRFTNESQNEDSRIIDGNTSSEDAYNKDESSVIIDDDDDVMFVDYISPAPRDHISPAHRVHESFTNIKSDINNDMQYKKPFLERTNLTYSDRTNCLEACAATLKNNRQTNNSNRFDSFVGCAQNNPKVLAKNNDNVESSTCSKSPKSIDANMNNSIETGYMHCDIPTSSDCEENTKLMKNSSSTGVTAERTPNNNNVFSLINQLQGFYNYDNSHEFKNGSNAYNEIDPQDLNISHHEVVNGNHNFNNQIIDTVAKDLCDEGMSGTMQLFDIRPMEVTHFSDYSKQVSASVQTDSDDGNSSSYYPLDIDDFELNIIESNSKVDLYLNSGTQTSLSIFNHRLNIVSYDDYEITINDSDVEDNDSHEDDGEKIEKNSVNESNLSEKTNESRFVISELNSIIYKCPLCSTFSISINIIQIHVKNTHKILININKYENAIYLREELTQHVPFDKDSKGLKYQMKSILIKDHQSDCSFLFRCPFCLFISCEKRGIKAHVKDKHTRFKIDALDDELMEKCSIMVDSSELEVKRLRNVMSPCIMQKGNMHQNSELQNENYSDSPKKSVNNYNSNHTDFNESTSSIEPEQCEGTKFVNVDSNKSLLDHPSDRSSYSSSDSSPAALKSSRVLETSVSPSEDETFNSNSPLEVSLDFAIAGYLIKNGNQLSYQCNYCLSSFSTSSELLAHADSHFIKCSYCNYKHMTWSKILEHCKVKHKDYYNKHTFTPVQISFPSWINGHTKKINNDVTSKSDQHSSSDQSLSKMKENNCAKSSIASKVLSVDSSNLQESSINFDKENVGSDFSLYGINDYISTQNESKFRCSKLNSIIKNSLLLSTNRKPRKIKLTKRTVHRPNKTKSNKKKKYSTNEKTIYCCSICKRKDQNYELIKSHMGHVHGISEFPWSIEIIKQSPVRDNLKTSAVNDGMKSKVIMKEYSL